MMALASIGPSFAAERTPDERLIANAGYLMKFNVPGWFGRLDVQSGDAAAIYGQNSDEIILLARRKNCLYEMADRHGYVVRVDFSELSSHYQLDCDRMICRLNILGRNRAYCFRTGRGQQSYCTDNLLINFVPEAQASVDGAWQFVRENGCPPVKIDLAPF
jgi:hypothetical protein